MTIPSSALESLKLSRERNDVRIYATDEKPLNEATALMFECNYDTDFHWFKSRLPEGFLGRKYLHIVIDIYSFDPNEFVGTYSIELIKQENKKYVGKESFDLSNQYFANCRTSLYKVVMNWAMGQRLDVKIKKIRKSAYNSPRKYFNKKAQIS